ncbi:MAG: hypothetical protein Q9211_006346 [Gyalolechia sp. 1 TL-2023]
MSSILSKQSVLVVGGCGFLGHHIVSQLLAIDAKVSVLDLKLDRNRMDSVEYHSADITTEADAERVIDRVQPQVIIHTASSEALGSDSALHFAVNVDGTRNLLECARKVKTVKAFVYTSSASVVHDTVSDLVNADETFPLVYLPIGEVYGHTKALADDLVRAANSPADGFLTLCLRPVSMFGEGDLYTVFRIEHARAGKNKFQVGSGKNLFDWVYVGNMAAAHILASEALLTRASSSSESTLPPIAGEAFFITNGEPMPFWDFVRATGEAAGFPVKKQDVWIMPQSVGLAIAFITEWMVWLRSLGKRKSTLNRAGIRYSCLTRTYSIDKAKARLGYHPKVDMSEGIRRAANWWLTEQEKKTQ